MYIYIYREISPAAPDGPGEPPPPPGTGLPAWAAPRAELKRQYSIV